MKPDRFLGNKQEALIKKYQLEVDRQISNMPLGWVDLLDEMIPKLIEAGWDRKVSQIKSKFGGLRFYVHDAPKEVYRIIGEAEGKSYSLCEACGKDIGVTDESQRNYFQTRCEEHKNLGWREIDKMSGIEW